MVTINPADCTPDEFNVRMAWITTGFGAEDALSAEFDRWLDQVKAAARREGQAEAWAEAHADSCEYVIDRACREYHPNPYRQEADQ